MIFQLVCIVSLLSIVVTISEKITSHDLVKELYRSYVTDKFPGLDDFQIEMFAPASGPFFLKLSELQDPEARHIDENGIPFLNNFDLVNDVGYPIYLPMQNNQTVFLLNKNNQWKQYRITGDVSMEEIAEQLMFKYVNDLDNNKKMFLNDEDLGTDGSDVLSLSALPLGERVAYAELQRPRALLPFFVDVFRIAYFLTAHCREVFGAKSESCAALFLGYPHMLSVYTQLICKHMTTLSHFDVDHVCPNLCAPRRNPLWWTATKHESNRRREEANNLLPVSKDAIDVCSQIRFAIPGSCKLYGRGVYDYEFTCQCINAAYEWKAEQGSLYRTRFPRCQLHAHVAEALLKSDGHIVKINCTPNEIKEFCLHLDTKSCFFEATQTQEVVSQVYSAELIRISDWPVCQCIRTHGGVNCERRRKVCSDPLDLNDEENHKLLAHLKRNVFNLPNILTGSWLCEDHLPGGKCYKDYHDESGFGFKCECAEGKTRDEISYKSLDNCKLRTFINKNHLQQLKNKTCIDGYAGDKCDLPLNNWSAWGKWGRCFPICGLYRRQMRFRICFGDFGCYGSSQMTQRCSLVVCKPLNEMKLMQVDSNDTASSTENISGSYYSPTLFYVLIVILGICLPIQIAIVVIITCLLYRIDKKRYKF